METHDIPKFIFFSFVGRSDIAVNNNINTVVILIIAQEINQGDILSL